MRINLQSIATEGTSTHKPDPAIIFDTLNAYQRSAAFKAAIELDLFTEIARGNRSADAIAKAVRASTRGVRILCDYLVISGFLVKDVDEYSLTLDSATFLDRNSPAYFGSVAAFLLDPRLIAPFLNLTDVIRAGTTTLPGEGSVSHDNPIWVDFAKQMAPMILSAAAEIADLVAGDGEIRVLDIAAGDGLFGIMIAQHNPMAQITALDWRNVLSVATENADNPVVSRALMKHSFHLHAGYLNALRSAKPVSSMRSFPASRTPAREKRPWIIPGHSL